MLKTPNSTISTELAALSSKAGAKISSAIQSASQKTGVDFSYLLQQAQVESSFKADAKAKTSSATGLYQFIDRTWLQMVNKYGDKYGLSQYADQISDTGKVANSKIKAEILNLRNDAKICSLMAGELACENKNYLESKVSGDIGSTELYMAHFMGPGGASKFLNALRSNPTASAADAFPQAAAANKGVFFTKSGKEKSLAEVYAFFDNKFKIESDVDITKPVVENSFAIAEGPTANALSAKALAYEHVYNEATKSWGRIRAAQSAPLAASWTPTDNLGGIAGLSPSFVSPVDILDLLKPDHSRLHSYEGRYNS
ncbi:MAG: transglycosylase SLT domain-containing protein [Alphaproteobacteria bacterium]|nr:transglycosylase SLT domain-containing protein [Alphaproteobacteria bacterium]